jgi:hypothetical protein
VSKKTLTLLGVLAFAGWVFRAMPLLRSAGFGYPVDYDEGVYFASASLILRGVFPYRDFVFVHPPGLLYALLPAAALSSWLDPAIAFVAARWASTLIGGANILLAGRVGMKVAGSVGGLIAAAVYAADPQVTSVERGVFLEPLLNLACLGLCWIWLGRAENRFDRFKVISAGVLCGVALSIKLWGALWFASCLLSLSRDRWREEALAFVPAALVTWALLLVPLGVLAPEQFFSQGMSFHLHRPPDGTSLRAARVGEMFSKGGRLGASVLVAVGLLGTVLGRGLLRSIPRRFLIAGFVVALAGFLASSTYWFQYNAHLAVPSSLLAGVGASVLWKWAANRRTPLARAGLATALIAALFPLAKRAVQLAAQKSPGLVARGQFIRSTIPPDACLFSFEPGWAIAGGRLPTVDPDIPLIIDPYAAMLLDAVQSGRRFADASAAFQDSSSQPRMKLLLDRCRFVVLGWRGRWQLSPETQEWFGHHFVQRMGDDDVWERSRRAP